MADESQRDPGVPTRMFWWVVGIGGAIIGGLIIFVIGLSDKLSVQGGSIEGIKAGISSLSRDIDRIDRHLDKFDDPPPRGRH